MLFGGVVASTPRMWLGRKTEKQAAGLPCRAECREKAYFEWLNKMRIFQPTCLFVVIPDVVYHATATLALFHIYAERVRKMGFPIALVAQNGLIPYQKGVFCGDTADYTDWCFDNGIDFDDEDNCAWWESMQAWKQTHIDWDEFDCLFIGGDIDWKLGEAARLLIDHARKAGKHVHVGRVNTRRRLRRFQLAGVHSVDGNALKYFDRLKPAASHAISTAVDKAGF